MHKVTILSVNKTGNVRIT